MAKKLNADELESRRNLAGAAFAVLAAIAGIAQATNAPVWLKVTFGIIALGGAILALTLLTKVHYRRRAEGERVRSAVDLSVSRDGTEASVWLTNKGLNAIQDIEPLPVAA